MDNVENTELKKVNTRLDVLSEDMKDIRKAILGDEYNTRGGYKQRLEGLETRVDTIEDFITKWKWILAGAVGLGGYGGLTFIQQLIEIISNAMHKK